MPGEDTGLEHLRPLARPPHSSSSLTLLTAEGRAAARTRTGPEPSPSLCSLCSDTSLVSHTHSGGKPGARVQMEDEIYLKGLVNPFEKARIRLGVS